MSTASCLVCVCMLMEGSLALHVHVDGGEITCAWKEWQVTSDIVMSEGVCMHTLRRASMVQLLHDITPLEFISFVWR